MAETEKLPANVRRDDKRCPQCGYVKRGPNHEEGDHHKMGENGHRKVRKN